MIIVLLFRLIIFRVSFELILILDTELKLSFLRDFNSASVDTSNK